MNLTKDTQNFAICFKLTEDKDLICSPVYVPSTWNMPGT